MFYLMVDVMARGHDGDGHEDPPPPGGRVRSQHEVDAAVPSRRRGRPKNLAFTLTWEKNGKQPLPLEVDGTIATTDGIIHADLFIQEASGFIWRDISLDRESWKKVSAAEKSVMYKHLLPFFDLQRVMEDCEQSRLKEDLEYMISCRYRGYKSESKKYFLDVGGYEDVETARANTPFGMSEENWNKSVTFFTSEKHKKRSRRNKANRANQVVKNRGGTSSYSNACYKKNVLVHELAGQTQLSASSSNLTPVAERAVFKVSGSRQRHVKGIERTPTGTTTSSLEGHSHTSQPTKVSLIQRFINAHSLVSLVYVHALVV